jgi:tripartite-type tricarboxylate transporter receptor subunit TctC
MKLKGWMTGKAILLIGFLLLLLPTLSMAQQYPTKPINILLGYGPGGTVDTIFRPLANAAEKYVGQPVVILNNGAGGGTVAVGLIVKEKPDGYNFEVCHSGLLTTTPHIRKLPYKLDDLVPIMSFGYSQSSLCVRADAPYKTFKELVEYARQNPGKFTYFHGTVGGPTHLAMEVVAKKEGVQFTPVPFQSGAQALTALLGGHVSGFTGGSHLPHVRAGTLRLLVVFSEKRLKEFPDVPTLRDLGYDYAAEDVFHIVAPKGVAPSIVQKLDESFQKAMDDPKFIQAMEKLEIVIHYRNHEDVRKYLDEAYKRFGKLIEEFNIPKEEEKK